MALSKEKKEKVIQDYRLNGKDTGSVEVQIALLSQSINELTEHLNRNKKDYSSKRGLLKKIGRRRKLLSYLGNSKENSYNDVTKRLGLKK
ncbi:MAG TPA: 30S ribosomal protein S15 [Candidatus Babeliales bacterium]|nr:30S ribosomal protein S15 [Candidatus Babeliales bacterium]